MADPTPRRPPFKVDYGIAPQLPDPLTPWSSTRAKLADARNYWITANRADGRPHAAPVWGVWVDDHFLFSTDAGSVKGRAIARSPHIVVHLESGDDVVILDGLARRLSLDDPTVEAFVAAYEPKYDFTFERPFPEFFAFYDVAPADATVWTEADFAN
jgi:hypothetical protein